MPRREARLDERPQHLRIFCEALRDVRRQSGLTLKQLSEKTHYAESTLSRVTNALDLPPWPQVEAFLNGCGGGDLVKWRRVWEATRMQHELFLSKGVNEPPAAKLENAAAAQTAALQHVLNDDRPATITAFLRDAETAQDLIAAIRMLGKRAGATSLRQMEERCAAANARIGKSTIRDWLAGNRRPTRLDSLVTALGATPAEQRQFAQCLERVWSRNPPVLQLSSGPAYTVEGTKRGRHCCIVKATLYDRAIDGGMVWIEEPAGFRHGIETGIVGLSVGPTHGMAGTMTLIPKTSRRGEIEIGIWVASPVEVSGLRLELGLRLETPDSAWPARLQIQLPTYRAPEISYAEVLDEAARVRTAAQAAALSRSRPSPEAAAAASVRMKPAPAVSPRLVQPEQEPYRPRHRKNMQPRGLLQRFFGRTDSD